VNGIGRRYIARLNSNGGVDLGFDPGFGANANVNAVGVSPGGKVLIGGDFTMLNGSLLNRFARLRSDGSIDLSFNIGTGADATVNAVVVQPDTAVVIGGSFTNVAGLTRNRIARVHGDDKYTPTSVQFDQSSYLVTEDGGSATIRIIRTGNTNVSFTATFLTTDGTATVDQDYTTNQTVLSFGGGETEKFVTVGILNDSNLELDETVLLLLTNVPSYVDVGRGSAVLVIQDDETSVQFASADYSTTESSNAVLTIVRSGKLDSELEVTYFTVPGTALELKDYLAISNRLAFEPFQATQNVVISIVDDSRKEFTESFQVHLAYPSGGTALGNNSIATVTILDDDLGPGSVDRSFTPGAGLNGFVKAAAVQPDGGIVVGGSFTQADNLARNHIARLATNGAVDVSFDPGQGANALVTAIALQSGGKIAIGGAFTQVNGTNRNRTAQLLANGQLDSVFALSNGINAAVHTILPTSQGRMLIGGAFTLPVRGIGRLRNDGTADTSFFPGLGANGNVYTIVQQPDGRLIVAGDFNTFNNAPRSRVARLQNDGTLDNSFITGTISTGAVQCVAVQSDGKIVIGGDFIRVNGVDRGHIARLNSDGTLDNSFPAGSGANGIVYAITLQADGKILIGGGFGSVSGTNRSGIARLNTDGSLDLTFDVGTGADGPVYAIALTPDEHVVIGGDFTVVNGIARRGIARLNPDDPIDIAFLPGLALANGAFQMLISAKPGHPYALEASSDLANWTVLRTNVAVGTTLSFTDTNAASFNQRFYRVRQVVP